MLKKSEFWILTALAVIGAALAITNMMLFQGNRAAQNEIAGRQQYVAQSVQLEGLYREIVKALADLSVKGQDSDLRALLAGQGITVSVTPNAPAPNASTTPSDVPKKAGK
jgi:hypothetical protein